MNLEDKITQNVSHRLVHLLMTIYFAASADRINLWFSVPQNNKNLGFKPQVFRPRAAFFFVG